MTNDAPEVKECPDIIASSLPGKPLLRRSKDVDGNPVMIVASWFWDELQALDGAEDFTAALAERDAEIAELKRQLTGLDCLLAWMQNREADYSADELRAMASKGRKQARAALSAEKEGG